MSEHGRGPRSASEIAVGDLTTTQGLWIKAKSIAEYACHRWLLLGDPPPPTSTPTGSGVHVVLLVESQLIQDLTVSHTAISFGERWALWPSQEAWVEERQSTILYHQLVCAWDPIQHALINVQLGVKWLMIPWPGLIATQNAMFCNWLFNSQSLLVHQDWSYND